MDASWRVPAVRFFSERGWRHQVSVLARVFQRCWRWASRICCDSVANFPRFPRERKLPRGVRVPFTLVDVADTLKRRARLTDDARHGRIGAVCVR